MQIRFVGLAITTVVLGTATAGCGSASVTRPPSAISVTGPASVTPPTSTTPPPSLLPPYAGIRHHVCTPTAAAVIASVAKVQTGKLSTRRARANTGAAECVFASRTSGHRLEVTVAVSGAPQPFAVMERGAEEEAQYWGERRLQPAPQSVFHLGIGAFWFPAEQHLETTDAVNLITVTIVRWAGASQHQRRVLATAAARPYLGPLQPKLARGPSPT